ncbi:MAG TPA: cobalamin biosynthesis protein CbiG [Phenylobacterium sp.]|uniref:cobalamin biosynthesis protein CbiG n=1 Tax=Phenylobacterium sp. TaxID=1871053 RepID=UPI002D4FFD51|nr:cobalamin biosynthesis protein CbiG [Phenylobacterium sp.]HZZ69342.1 cobalamin biosynthesis protein CbiG [Phenylobacterium sp.]
MPRLFSAYVIVDWSAASKPTTGADSIWIGVLKRDVRFRLAFESFNEATRAAAETRLNAILADLKKRSERALVGFDFPMGFPRGFADAMKLKGDPWRAAWDELGKRVVDKPTNVNNRFNVAAQLNRLLTDGPFPFWGAPPKDVQTTLMATKPRAHGPGDLPEFRHADLAAKGAASIWKTYYNGSVGGQAIMGVPVARRLKDARAGAAKVWPFETGFKALTEADLGGVDLVMAEVYPSLVKGAALPGEVKDQTQVRLTAEYFARLDEANKLGEVFAPPKGTAADVVLDAEREEGWILGAGA